MSKITKRKYVEQEVQEFVLPSGNQQIVKVTGGKGNNLHEVIDAFNNTFLVSMPTKFRKNIWIKRGDYVIIDPIEEGDKVRGEIAHILFSDHIRDIQEEGLWPEAFEQGEAKPTSYIQDDMLPPSGSDDEEDLATMVVNANKGKQLYEQYSSEDDEEEDDEEEEEEEVEEDVEEKQEEGEKACDPESEKTNQS
ncbi:hypothetical protein ACOMHN_044957 [Nucella lapillus]